MNNPYDILGVREDATDEDVKKAYRELVKQYHPDKYKDSPLASMAEEKIKEINVAYDTIQKQRASGQTYSEYTNTAEGANGAYGAGNASYNSANSAIYNNIIILINRGAYEEAQNALETIQESMRDAFWYYLMGETAKRRGWYDAARSYYTTAIQMDPGNNLYRDALNGLYSRTTTYRQASRGRGYSDAGDNFCNICQSLICLDCCCECCGGDLIPCC